MLSWCWSCREVVSSARSMAFLRIRRPTTKLVLDITWVLKPVMVGPFGFKMVFSGIQQVYHRKSSGCWCHFCSTILGKIVNSITSMLIQPGGLQPSIRWDSCLKKKKNLLPLNPAEIVHQWFPYIISGYIWWISVSKSSISIAGRFPHEVEHPHIFGELVFYRSLELFKGKMTGNPYIPRGNTGFAITFIWVNPSTGSPKKDRNV